MSTPNRIKIAIVGCGAIFENNHLKVLIDSKLWEVAYLVDKDEFLLKKYSSLLGCNYGTNIDLIPNEINACLVATPNFLHVPQSIELLNRGFHVICEKPVGLNIEEVEKLQEAVNISEGYFFIVHQMRYLETIRFLRNELINIPINTLKQIDISYGNPFNWSSQTNFYTDSQKAGGGVLIDLGVHLIDLLISLWSGIKINESHCFATEAEPLVMDTAITCYGHINDHIPVSIRASRINQLNNSLRIKTSQTELECSLGSNQVQVKSLSNGKIISQKTIITPESNPFELFWESVYYSINDSSPSIFPSSVHDGITSMKLIRQIMDNLEIIMCK
nr:Gfo/Idh/MocA family oxidoreductase [uncultured Carboxylicivirga sp.]